MAERQHDSLVTSLESLKQLERERLAEQRAAAEGRARAEQAAREAAQRRVREAEAARQHAEAERQRLETERRAALERQAELERRTAERQAAIAHDERQRRTTVAAQAVAAARSKAKRLRWSVAISLVVAPMILGGIGYQVHRLYQTKGQVVAVLARNEAHTRELRAQLHELKRELHEDLRRNRALIGTLQQELERAPMQAREELAQELLKAKEQEQAMEAQQERTRRRFGATERATSISERL